MNRLIYTKTIDKSVLWEGFGIKSCYIEALTDIIGTLDVGQKRTVKFILNGNVYDGIDVKNQAFDRQKYANHGAIYQVRYKPQSDFAKALRAIYADAWAYIEAEQRAKDLAKKAGVKCGNIKLPQELQFQIAFYATDFSDVWMVETFGAQDTQELKSSLLDLPELDYERFDDTAAIHMSRTPSKLRALDRSIGETLKRLYNHRCQVCGTDLWRSYGENSVIEAHHIIPFTESLNNDYDNILVMCPNHHRIIHANHGEYKRKVQEIWYPNGFHEPLKLNIHL